MIKKLHVPDAQKFLWKAIARIEETNKPSESMSFLCAYVEYNFNAPWIIALADHYNVSRHTAQIELNKLYFEELDA